ncbi:MAG: DASS family sodium-coupled anion symporter [Candidatus Marinimicrobia bacterium]|jgi:sodium-dependent dicarboxylate transporter 2/3/5|nr:DASS family sodium-coupled anion symporter [Candidatus Neomarinimicrobiota bacterium]MBT3633117.1 DASS family sodium-coupled anion symporter [Candidatus Neomarinimicrobiota bacterium]MBT3682282.1 DASS family sodium-coupled anion symporter [Candidatus Neomarinimicrobiota bacterium]MBT3758717.1 DASS family sodium-coupled anion symporter [Candidatus Neomarinimicrobiota bacterium]MBT3895409.1 DASS family sodium-coupled anion symporter [Candidatus Neomarinimicrobiota bacterium]
MYNDVIRAFLFWIQQKKWLLLIIAVGVAMYWLPYPDTISTRGYRALILGIMVISLIITEPVPLPAVALLIAVLEVSFRIAPATEVAKSYMSDSVFFIMGSLMMAVAIVHQGLDTRLALGIIKLTGNSVNRIVFGFVAISAILSSFVGEHTVVAMMLPVGLTLVRHSSVRKPVPNLTALLLFSIAYGSTIGSVGTPSGGARNAIMIEYLRGSTDAGVTLSYVHWIIMAYPMVIFGIISTTILLKVAFKPEYTNLDTAIRKLKIQVAHKGKMTGKDILTIGIFVFIFLCWVLLNERIGMGIIAITGAFLYMATGIVEWEDISKNTNWGVILLFAGAISLGVQMKNMGTAVWIGENIINATGGLMEQFELVRYMVVIGLTMILSNVMSSSGTVAVLGPITLNMGGEPVFMGMATAVASAFGYFSAVAAPACMIIYSSGLVKMTDFLKAGWRLGLASFITLLIVYKWYWPLVIGFTNFK